MPPLVSVITSNFNCGRYLPACIASVAGQTFANWEHLIVDCGSEDGSADVLRQLRHPRLRTFARGPLPVTAARNLLLREARGKFIAVLDADDTCRADRLDRQVKALETGPALIAVGAWVRLWHQQTDVKEKVSYPVRTQEIARLYSAGVNIIPHSTLLARRESMLRLDGYDERLRKAEDYDLIHRLTRLGPVSALPLPLVDYCTRNQEIDAKIRQLSIDLNRLYVAYSLMLRVGGVPSRQPPFARLDESTRPLLDQARGQIRRACWRGLISPSPRIGWHCRGLLGIRLNQTWRHEG